MTDTFGGPISGATQLDDISDLKLAITTLEELSEEEAQNILSGQVKHLGTARRRPTEWLTVRWLTRLHHDMFDRVWNWAGKFRKSVKNIGVMPPQIQVELTKLLEDARFWAADQTLSPLEQSARLQHRLVWIHPFENGNGRHARFVGDLYLKSVGERVPTWPNGLSGETTARAGYLAALREADRGNLKPLVDYMAALL